MEKILDTIVLPKNVMPFVLLLLQNACYIFSLYTKYLVETFHWTISQMFSNETPHLELLYGYYTTGQTTGSVS